MNEKKSCGMKHCKTCFKNMSCELKLAYILILVLLLSNIFIFLKLSCCSKNNNNAESMKEFIDNNPKVILDSVQRYVEKEQVQAQKKQSEQMNANVKKNLDRIRDEKNTGVANPKGDKTVVVFYDYNCGYCKMATKAIENVAKSDSNVKVVFRDFPIFGGISNEAAKYSVAVAIATPSKFLDFHSALMEGDAKSMDGIENALKSAKISVERIKRTLKSREKDIEKRLNDNIQLGKEIGLNGTPALLIGDELVPGYVEENALRAKLK